MIELVGERPSHEVPQNRSVRSTVLRLVDPDLTQAVTVESATPERTRSSPSRAHQRKGTNDASTFFAARSTGRPLLTHTYACALPTRGSCCDCGVLAPDHLRF
jgi:hypothetical protein